MTRRITEVWPRLIRTRANDGDGEGPVAENDAEPNIATPDQLTSLRESTAVIYKNLLWTRIIPVESAHPEEPRSWPVATDLADEFDVLFTIDEDALPEFEPRFDSNGFVKRNPEPKMEAWRLDEGRLKALAISATKIRARIDEKAATYREENEVVDRGLEN